MISNINEAKSYVRNNVKREDITSKGGGIEISLDDMGVEGGLMSAYQNYLGGGMLGSIQVNHNGRASDNDLQIHLLGQALQKEYYTRQQETCENVDSTDYDDLQKRPASAY